MKSASEPLEGTASAPDLSVVPPLDPAAEIADLKSRLAWQEERATLHESRRNELMAELAKLEKNPLLMALNVLDAGHVLEDAGSQLTELVALVGRRQEKGVLLVKFEVKPFKADAVVCSAEIKVTEPKAPAQQAVFYANEEGELSRQDPRQRELALDR
jgi:hypothetical protein